MLNNTLATITLWSWPAPIDAIQDDFSINDLWLQNQYICVSNISDNVNVDISSFDRPQINGRWFLSNFKRWRNITLSVTIKWTSKTDMEERLDNLRKEIYKEESILSWKRADWEYRKIKVNCTNSPEIFNHYNITFLKTDITFESLEPFWYKDSYQSRNITSKTSNFSEEITNEWKAVSDLKIYIIFNTASVTETKVKVNNEEIIINQSITTGDILLIDWEEKIVSLNGTEIDYSWLFPSMWTSSNFFTYTITWTFDLDTIILNRKNYV